MEKKLDLMVSSKEPKPEELKDIQKIHGLSISQELHILHNIYPFESPLLVNSSAPLYTLSLIAIVGLGIRVVGSGSDRVLLGPGLSGLRV